MNYHTLVGRISGYIVISTTEIAIWLERRLPRALGENWWETGVLESLTENQLEIIKDNNINSLAELDLSALLRITDRNWYSLWRPYSLKQSERMTIQKMQSVRNNWAHAAATPPDEAIILADLKTLGDFLGFVGVNHAEIREFERLCNEIEQNGLSSTPSATKTTEKVNTDNITTQSTLISEITLNSTVRIISGPTKIGVVTGIDNVGDTKKFKVFVDNKFRDFYEEQIELVYITESYDFSNITVIQRVLTAYQIRKPSSDSLYSLNAARIDFVPYQFRPALKLIKADMPRLLIADGVGVGKTIEAGLLIKELQARSSLETIIIICPRPLVAEQKWEMEMKRFDENFTPVNGDLLRNIIQEADRDGEWPEKYRRLIIPYSLLTDDLLSGQEKKHRKTPGLEKLDPAPFFDLVIVDEAHHVRNTQTQAHRAVRYFCENANAAVFLTATPIQLGNQDLFSLLNLLRPDTVIDMATFNAMAEPNSYINEAIRNLRISNHEKEALNALQSASYTGWGRSIIEPNPVYHKVVKTLSDGKLSREQRVKLINDVETLHSFEHLITRTRRQDIEDFCTRRAVTLRSQFTDRQRELHDELLGFNAAVLATLHPTISLKFLMCTIRRQAASCIFGLAPYIKHIVQRGLESLTDDGEIQEDIEDAIIKMDEFVQLAKNVITLAEDLPEEDSKFDGLAEIILERQNRNKNKMIIFSTFRHTLKYLRQKITALNGVRVGYVDGEVKDDERYETREKFALPKSDPNALDILLFTEIGSEGLDYQFCDTIVNYDLPWNPMRIEQRIGRIDRRGQESDIAHIYNCVTHGTIDEEIHERCLMRIGVFEQSIGDCSEILGNIANSIKEIILDVELTDEERSAKLEQLADNEVRQVEEMRRLEDEEKHMFGVDISSYINDVGKADNPWLSSVAIRRLVTGYLSERLKHDKPCLTDDKLKLTIEEKSILADDLRTIGRTSSDAKWESFLRSGSKVCRITFDHEEAKNPKVLFLTPVHPLVRQAANFYSTDAQYTTAIEISSSELTPGTYLFQLYLWDYTGGKSQAQLVPICANEDVQQELSSIMQSAVSTEIEPINAEQEWEKLAEIHLESWKTKRDSYRNDFEDLCRFKIESLKNSIEARKNIAKQQINSTTSESIITMRKSEIERLDSEFTTKKKKLEDSIRLADIHMTHLLDGVLVVREG